MELWGIVAESLDILRSHSIIRAYGLVIYSQAPESLLQQAPSLPSDRSGSPRVLNYYSHDV